MVKRRAYFYANDGHTCMIGRIVGESADFTRIQAETPFARPRYGVPRGPSEPTPQVFEVRASEVREIPGS